MKPTWKCGTKEAASSVGQLTVTGAFESIAPLVNIPFSSDVASGVICPC
jgi:hypothetical protein